MTAAARSAPGPDGIPYAAWASSFFGITALYCAYCVWSETGFVPFMFNSSFLWLLPKTNPKDGIFSPADTRPLSGANTDSKLMCMALAEIFNRVLNDWAVHIQRGFIRGRCMIRTVIEVESAAVVYSSNPNNNACIV